MTLVSKKFFSFFRSIAFRHPREWIVDLGESECESDSTLEHASTWRAMRSASRLQDHAVRRDAAAACRLAAAHQRRHCRFQHTQLRNLRPDCTEVLLRKGPRFAAGHASLHRCEKFARLVDREIEIAAVPDEADRTESLFAIDALAALPRRRHQQADALVIADGGDRRRQSRAAARPQARRLRLRSPRRPARRAVCCPSHCPLSCSPAPEA